MKAPVEPELLIFRVIDFGLSPDHYDFSINSMSEELKLKPHEIDTCKRLISPSLEGANPNHIFYIKSKVNATGHSVLVDDFVLTLLPSAIIMYNEYEEIKLAGRNAKEARIESAKAYRLALLAFWVSFTVGVVQILIDLLKH